MSEYLSSHLKRSNTFNPDLSIVIPVYCSEGCLVALYNAIVEALTPTGLSHELILVNDCSTDQSWQVIKSLCKASPQVMGVDLRRNFGQDNAILTGIRLACGKYIAIMDDDLQHHPKFLPALVQKIEEGADVVYANFQTKHQKLWKNVGSWINGKIAEWVLYKPKGIYLSPYKAICKDVAESICCYAGPTPYIDGLLFQVTSKIAQVPAEHYPRFDGRSSFSFLQSVGVSARLAFSFSVRPLRLISWCGFVFAVCGILLIACIIGYRLLFPELFTAEAVGWASLMVAILFAWGLQMIFFGTLGEYTGRTYLVVTGKPQAAIREVVNGPDQSNPRAAKRFVDEVRVVSQSDLSKRPRL
jgi:undecaprenyl-phosphate 4-deoxy-4-formamido-L-arabinose transferase